MKTTELQELFANANTAQDIIAIFEANPGLEDEILELGKKQGINLDGPRELTDLELELVAGGLTLKKGVMVTMSILLLAGTLTVPLSQAAKAHAATPRQNAGIERVDNDKTDSDKVDTWDTTTSNQSNSDKTERQVDNASDNSKADTTSSTSENSDITRGAVGLGTAVWKTASSLLGNIMPGSKTLIDDVKTGGMKVIADILPGFASNDPNKEVKNMIEENAKPANDLFIETKKQISNTEISLRQKPFIFSNEKAYAITYINHVKETHEIANDIQNKLTSNSSALKTTIEVTSTNRTDEQNKEYLLNNINVVGNTVSTIYSDKNRGIVDELVKQGALISGKTGNLAKTQNYQILHTKMQ